MGASRKEAWMKDVTRGRQSTVQFYKPFSAFTNGIIFGWKKSIWQLVLPELALWLVCFGIISVVYRLLDRGGQDRLEAWFEYCKNFAGLMPLGIIIGFYVSTCYGRWWEQWKTIPWIGATSMLVRDLDNRDNEEGYVIRWTLMRWMLLGMAITFQTFSKNFLKRYPDLQSLAAAGLTNQAEIEILQNCASKTELCHNWALQLIRRQEETRADYVHQDQIRLLRKEVLAWRLACAILRGFNNHPLPLVYSQLMAFCIYMYFFVALFGRQYFLNKDDVPTSTPVYMDQRPIDFYIPFASCIEFCFYCGLYKLAGMLYCPFDTHGCELVLTRIFTEQIAWARQGCCFVDKGWMPAMDPAMIPHGELTQLPPEEREDLDLGEEEVIVRRATMDSAALTADRRRLASHGAPTTSLAGYQP